MKTLVFVVWTVLRTFVPVGLLAWAIWWIAGGATHPGRFWWIVGGIFLVPVAAYGAFAGWIAISWILEGRRNLREARRRQNER